MPSSVARCAVPFLLFALLGGAGLRGQVPEEPRVPIAGAIAEAERWIEEGGRALDAERIVARLAVDRPATITWLCYAGLLGGRLGLGWRGRRAAWVTVAGFVAALLVLTIYFVRRAVGA